MRVDLAFLVLRLSVAWVFLFAAWKNTENKAAWTWTRNETAILLTSVPEPNRSRLALLMSIAGMAMMYGGGLSILTGVEPRAGGLAIAAFSLLGMRIHAIRRDEAKRAADAGDPMGWSAFGAHTAARLKNWALAGAGVFFFLVGSGGWGAHLDGLGTLLGWRPQ